ncbi:hypothetical protein LguiA_022067 [Lonicera macranthoides]
MGPTGISAVGQSLHHSCSCLGCRVAAFQVIEIKSRRFRMKKKLAARNACVQEISGINPAKRARPGGSTVRVSCPICSWIPSGRRVMASRIGRLGSISGETKVLIAVYGPKPGTKNNENPEMGGGAGGER